MLPLALSALAACTTLGPQAEPPPVSDVPAIVERIAELLEQHYVFPDVAAACAAHLRAELAAGRLESGAPGPGFAQRVTSALQSISHDKHMNVRQRARGAPRSEVDPVAAHGARMEDMRRSNFGFRRVEILEGNVGYIDLRSFSTASVTRSTLCSALGVVAGVDALIIDRRTKGGGDPETVRLLGSYFFDAPTHLNSLYFRATDSLTEYWTLADVPGSKLLDTPLFILTSPFTFSAAEGFTYHLKHLGRAKVVGETSGGGANPGDTFAIDEAWTIFVPTGRAINPVTGTNWEGTGVAPDVEVQADQALERAIGLARVAAGTGDPSGPRGELRAAVVADAGALAADLAEDLAAGDEDARETLHELWNEGVELGVVDPLLLLAAASEEAPPIARVLLEVATSNWPEVLEPWRELARVLRQAGDPAGAREALGQILAIDPHDTRARVELEAL